MSVRLGCPDEYLAFITDRTLETKLTSLPFSELSWARVLDDISEAQVTIPDSAGGLRCCSPFGGLLPWKHGLRIERNSELVWCGPIVQVLRSSGTDAEPRGVTVTASDKMAWLRRRLIRRSLDYSAGRDPGFIFRVLVEEGTRLDNVFNLTCPSFFTGFTVYREYLANNFITVYDQLQELADAAVDFTMIGDELVAARDVANIQPGFGLVTPEWFDELPGFTVDGWEQANSIYTPLPDSGEDGFRRWGFYAEIDPQVGLLDIVDSSFGDSLLDVNYANLAAKSIFDLRGVAPVTLSGGSLSQRAAVSIRQLIPGIVCPIDLGDDGCFSHLVQNVRIKRIDVQVQIVDGALGETVTPEWQPLGTVQLEGLQSE